VREIAKALLFEDQSQIEYYEQITKRMVGLTIVSEAEIPTTPSVGDGQMKRPFSSLLA
jgi:hypothetical protein